ncbi:MAG TPA: GNAT family N-acetyltransferase [Candidatus Dormibacteraeota bacterium]|nr:GNAT family N-acetyltransferase [Candidatus Dormibacteraeota bacterium]
MPAALNLCTGQDPRWLRFIGSRPEATLFHHPAWSDVLAGSYGHRARLLVQTDGAGEIVAGLPLMEMRGRFNGQGFESLPFTDHCPPLAVSPEDLARFTTNLVRQREELGIRRIAIHGALPDAPGVERAARAVQHLLPLDGGVERIAKGFKSSVRWGLRKAERLGVEARVSQSASDLDPFYRLHVETRRRLGVPVQPKRFIEAVFEQVVLKGLGFVAFAYKDGRPIAAALYLAWNGNLIYKFSASDPTYWDHQANYVVMRTAIEWACQRGYRLLDMGRTDLANDGLRAYKRRWGAMEVPLVYSYVAQTPPGAMARVPLWALAKVIQVSPPIVCRAAGELLYGRVAVTVA